MSRFQPATNTLALNESGVQTQYQSEVTTAKLGDRVIRLENLTPILSPKDRDEREREIENRLFQVFIRYTGKTGR